MRLAPDVIKLIKIPVWFGSGSDPSCKCSSVASRAECGTGLDCTNLQVHTSNILLILARYRCCNLHVSKYHHTLTGPDGKDGVSSLNITTTTSVGAKGEGGGSVECLSDFFFFPPACVYTRDRPRFVVSSDGLL